MQKIIVFFLLFVFASFGSQRVPSLVRLALPQVRTQLAHLSCDDQLEIIKRCDLKNDVLVYEMLEKCAYYVQIMPSCCDLVQSWSVRLEHPHLQIKNLDWSSDSTMVHLVYDNDARACHLASEQLYGTATHVCESTEPAHALHLQELSVEVGAPLIKAVESNSHRFIFAISEFGQLFVWIDGGTQWHAFAQKMLPACTIAADYKIALSPDDCKLAIADPSGQLFIIDVSLITGHFDLEFALFLRYLKRNKHLFWHGCSLTQQLFDYFCNLPQQLQDAIVRAWGPIVRIQDKQRCSIS